MMHIDKTRCARAAIAAFAFAFAPASAAILTVGHGKMFKNPKAAADAAHRGDTIRIYPGKYGGAVFYPCCLTIEGVGPGATISGKLKMRKALFVINGHDVTIRNLTFAGAKNRRGNGAAIHADGTNLTVLDSRFHGNQNGILTGSDPLSTITVRNSAFVGNGACISSCAHAIYAGRIGVLDVRDSTFNGTRRGHSIKSRAIVTNIVNNRIADGPGGTSSYLIDLPKGGTATIVGNTLEKGRRASNATYAISIGEEGRAKVPGVILIAGNTYRNDKRPKGVFVRNLTGWPTLTLTGNTLLGYQTTMLEGPGAISSSGSSANAATTDVSALTAALETDAPVLSAPTQASARTETASAGLSAEDSIPEPATIALFAAAIAGLGWLRRRGEWASCRSQMGQ